MRFGWVRVCERCDAAAAGRRASSRAERDCHKRRSRASSRRGAAPDDRLPERIAEALDARVSVRLYWHGEELDRLLDAAHAGLVDQVVAMLAERGWEVIPEATFNNFGERGSIDVLAWHPVHGALLIVEVKSVVPDIQALLAGVDRKVRIAPKLAAERGWRVRSVSRLIVLPEDRTARRRVGEFAATFDRLSRADASGSAVDRRACRPIAGILFLPAIHQTTARRRVRGGRGRYPADFGVQ